MFIITPIIGVPFVLYWVYRYLKYVIVGYWDMRHRRDAWFWYALTIVLVIYICQPGVVTTHPDHPQYGCEQVWVFPDDTPEWKMMLDMMDRSYTGAPCHVTESYWENVDLGYHDTVFYGRDYD